MKKNFFILILFCIVASVNAQNITKAYFQLSPEATGIHSIELEIDHQYLIALNGEGEIQYMETLAGAELLETDCVRLNIPVKFYDSHDIHDIPGRIKSIGNIKITYNNAFDIHESRGTIKSIGDIKISYYNAFDIHDPQGKVKSVGNVKIQYYNVFDPSHEFGGIKAITGNCSGLTVRRYRHYNRF